MSYVRDSRMRTCDWPGCSDAYDAATGAKCVPGETPWRMHKTFGLHMCGNHVPLTFGDDSGGGGPHCPRFVHGTNLAGCSCGQILAAGRYTLGEVKEAYREHLTAVAPDAPGVSGQT